MNASSRVANWGEFDQRNRGAGGNDSDRGAVDPVDLQPIGPEPLGDHRPG
jgi:hypothetical protein